VTEIAVRQDNAPAPSTRPAAASSPGPGGVRRPPARHQPVPHLVRAPRRSRATRRTPPPRSCSATSWASPRCRRCAPSTSSAAPRRCTPGRWWRWRWPTATRCGPRRAADRQVTVCGRRRGSGARRAVHLDDRPRPQGRVHEQQEVRHRPAGDALQQGRRGDRPQDRPGRAVGCPVLGGRPRAGGARADPHRGPQDRPARPKPDRPEPEFDEPAPPAQEPVKATAERVEPGITDAQSKKLHALLREAASPTATPAWPTSATSSAARSSPRRT
jgi:hypothetical protein